MVSLNGVTATSCRQTQVPNHETYFPTQHPQARSRARLPRSHGHQERSSGSVASSRQDLASDRLICLTQVVSRDFSRDKRLLTARQFTVVFDFPTSKVPGKHILLLARENGLDHPRLGLVIGKKNVGSLSSATASNAFSVNPSAITSRSWLAWTLSW